MYNWIKKGIMTVGIILSITTAAKSQTIDQIISEYHQGDGKVTMLTLQQAIDKGMENREDIYRINITKKQSKEWIKYEKQRLNGFKVNANTGIGYNFLDKKTKPYISGGITLTLPTFRPDNKKLINIKKIQEEITVIRAQEYIAEATSEIIHQFIDIKDLEAKKRYNEFFINYLDSIQKHTKNKILLQIGNEKISNYITELKDNNTSLKVNLENKRSAFNSTLGIFSNEKIYLLNKLSKQSKQLFSGQDTTELNKQKEIEKIAAAAVIIRTEKWKLDKDIAILNYEKNTNIDYSLGGIANIRREQFPEEANYAPVSANGTIALGGTGKRSLRSIAQGDVNNKKSHIREDRNNIFPKIIQYFSEMNEAIDKTTEKRRTRYKTEFDKAILNYCHNNTQDTTIATQIVNEVIEASKHHRGAFFEYQNNISLANHRAISIKWYVLFNSNPIKYANILEQRKHKNMK